MNSERHFNDWSLDFEFRGRQIRVKGHTDISGCNGKMVGFLLRDTGGTCHYCLANCEECNSMENILTGFSITKTYDECKRIWDGLKSASGEIKFGDRERGGMMHEPITGCAFFGRIILEELRSFDFVQHIYYRLISGVYDWNNTKTFHSRPKIMAAKQRAI